MPLINCKISLELTWSENCVLSANAGNNNDAVTFTMTDANCMCLLLVYQLKIQVICQNC